MPTINKVMLLGRLTRDVEVRTFASGGRVANLGLAVSSRRKNSQTGQYEDSAVFVDCEAFGKQAEFAEQYLRKGSQALIEGKLKMDSWTDRTTGQQRSKLKVTVDSIQSMDRRPDAGTRPPASEAESRPATRQAEQPARRAPAPRADELPPSGQEDLPTPADEEPIPF